MGARGRHRRILLAGKGCEVLLRARLHTVLPCSLPAAGKFLGGYDHNWVSLPPELRLPNPLLQAVAGASPRGGSPAAPGACHVPPGSLLSQVLFGLGPDAKEKVVNFKASEE